LISIAPLNTSTFQKTPKNSPNLPVGQDPFGIELQNRVPKVPAAENANLADEKGENDGVV